MARNRGHRGWNVSSERKDNRKDGGLIVEKIVIVVIRSPGQGWLRLRGISHEGLCP